MDLFSYINQLDVFKVKTGERTLDKDERSLNAETASRVVQPSEGVLKVVEHTVAEEIEAAKGGKKARKKRVVISEPEKAEKARKKKKLAHKNTVVGSGEIPKEDPPIFELHDESGSDLLRSGPNTDDDIMRNTTVLTSSSNTPSCEYSEEKVSETAQTGHTESVNVESSGPSLGIPGAGHQEGTSAHAETHEGSIFEHAEGLHVSSGHAVDEEENVSDSEDFYHSVSVDTADASSTYVPKWSSTNGFRMDDPWVCRNIVDNVAPPVYASVMRDMSSEDLLNEFNLLSSRQICMNSEVRLRLEHELYRNSRLGRKLERKEKLVSDLRTRLSEVERETVESSELRGRVSSLEAVVKTKDEELGKLRAELEKLSPSVAMVGSLGKKNAELASELLELRGKNEVLGQKVSGLEIICDTLEKQVQEQMDKHIEESVGIARASFEECISGMEEKLAQFNEEFDTELFPQLLRAVEGRRWVIGHGFRYAFLKFKESEDLKTRLGACITAAISDGVRQGLEAGVVHGARGVKLEEIAAYDPAAKECFQRSVERLANVPFPLLEALEACKDAPLEYLMAKLVLEEDRHPESGEFTFKSPVAEETVLPESVLRFVTRRPKAVEAYKEYKNRKYGVEFDYSDRGLAVVLPAPIVSRPSSSTNPAAVEPVNVVTPAAALTEDGGAKQMVKTVDVYGFPGLEPADKIKTFLEGYTGIGSIEALEVKQKNEGRRAYATVQFTTREEVDYIIDLASRRLWYGRSYLKVREKDMDLVKNPRHYALEMDGVTLHFGCQVSKQVLSVLHTMKNASVKFGFGAKKLYFGVTEYGASYKLQLLYENIWQVQFHRPRGLTSSFLVIQLFGAPRIYKKVENNVYNFYREDPDDQWVRATDFTSSESIGQSSHLCLGLSRDVDLNLGDYFPYYEESNRPFNLTTGHSFSPRSDAKLVPIVGPGRGVCLPYNIVFKICALVQHGCIPGPVLDSKFYELLDPQRRDLASIDYVLEKLYYLKEFCYEPVKWITEEYRKNSRLRAPAISLDPDAGLVYVRRVQITPSKVYFCGPEINVSNRVLRHYSDYIDNFLRVSFVDEELEKLYSTDLSPRAISQNAESKTGIYTRILLILKDGIVIGGKKFEFLAFSSSQLRDNSAWMFAATGIVNAASIREWMGDFSRIKNVAKYAARLGQSFGSSKESLSVAQYEVGKISDVEIVRNGTNYVFSDGIGKISAAFAKRVSKKCGYGFIPSAFQIRYAGYKGVVAVDPTSDMKLSLRKSMSKFESDNTKLDILAISKYQPCYMNRQLITLLSTLGVRDYVFERKQKEAVELLDAILKEPLKAQEALELMSPGENTDIMKEMLSCGYKPNAEPFLSMMLQVFRAAKLLEIRTKTRIFVPKGRAMMGCLDETRTLEYGEVFVQFSGAGKRPFSDDHSGITSNECKIFVGKVVVAKNPCLHPGDVRVLKAVDIPALHHMVDCVVFPQKGQRPHPNECSGSDLDGDIYFVCWDQDLIPPRQVEPMDYTPAPSIELDRNVTIEEVEECFTNYIVNDSLGIIANAHTVFADQEPLKAMSEPCVELAKLFSVAVDFPKTGVPAEIPTNLRVKEYPDFMEKPDKPTYQSGNVIGKLFREVKDIAPQNNPVNPFTREVAEQTYDTDMEVDGFTYYLDEAFDFKSEYDYKLGNLMDYYGIKTEAELLSGSIMKMSRSFDRRNDAEAVGLAVKSLRKEARNWFKKDGGNLDEGDDDVYAKASAWYHVTYHPDYWGKYNQDMTRVHFLSFPWCIHDKLIEIKRRKVLQSQFNTALNLV